MCVNSVFPLSPFEINRCFICLSKNANKLQEMTTQLNEVLIWSNLEDGPRILLNPGGSL